jgi:hypothetical protein
LDWESISTDANLEVAIAGRWRVDPPTTHTHSSKQRQRRACSGTSIRREAGGRRRSGDRNDRLADVPHARVLSLLLLLLLPRCLAGDDQTCAIRSRYGNEQEARKSESGLIAHSGVGNSRSGSSTFHSLGISPPPTWTLMMLTIRDHQTFDITRSLPRTAACQTVVYR